MTSLLHQLENNEAILLMYLADELSSEDRADVERQLANDAPLRADLDRLRALQDDTMAAMQRLEAATRLPASQGVAVRRATRMMRQWQVDRLTAAPEPEPVRELRFPWWSYPLTTAAAVLIAFLVWWGNRPERMEPRGTQYVEEAPAGPQDLDSWRAQMMARDLEESLDISDDELLMMAVNGQVDDAIKRLAATAKPAGDLELIFLNATERNW